MRRPGLLPDLALSGIYPCPQSFFDDKTASSRRDAHIHEEARYQASNGNGNANVQLQQSGPSALVDENHTAT